MRAGRKLNVDLVKFALVAAGALPIGKGKSGDSKAPSEGRPSCKECHQAALGRDEGLHGHHPAGVQMRGTCCVPGLLGRCSTHPDHWACRAPWCHKIHVEPTWAGAAYGQTREFLRGRPLRVAEKERKKSGLTVLGPPHEIALLHTTRAFIGLDDADWQQVSALLAQTSGDTAGVTTAQCSDCVSQHARRSTEMDPRDGKKLRRYV